MSREKVVFIIGAGASADYEMPLGGTLAETVAADTDFRFERLDLIGGDPKLHDLLRFGCDPTTASRYINAGPRLAAVISSSASDAVVIRINEFAEQRQNLPVRL
jgi:hypothetical protein